VAAPIVTLPAEAAAFVAGGGRDVDTAKLTEVAGLAAGAVVPLVDPRGDELGVALHDPDNQRLRVMVTPADGFPTVSGAVLGWRVERALAWRKQLGLPGEDATYRVLNGAGDGVPGFTCDVLGRYAVLYAYAPALVPWARQLAEAVRGFVGVRGVVIKVRARGGASDVAQEIVGETPPERYVAAEHGVPSRSTRWAASTSACSPTCARSASGSARFVGGGAVANLFSYTGDAVAACARAGARAWCRSTPRTASRRGPRGNFARAGFAPDDQALAVRDRRRGAVPGARGQGQGALPADRDRSADVLDGARRAVDARSRLPGADRPGRRGARARRRLWLAANTHELGSLTRLVGKGLKAAGKDGVIVAQGGLPADYPTVAPQPRDRYLQIVVVRVA
jgi:23S rRNA (cytosine1962-C5)-methyltransferase